MGFSSVVFFCIIILTATHVLDGVFKRCAIKKSHVLLFVGIFFAVSVMPVYNINRYLTLHLLYPLSVVAFVALAVERRHTPLFLKEMLLVFFIIFIYVIDMILSLMMNTRIYYYAELIAVAIFCAAYIQKPQDGFISAYFGVWFLQFIFNIKNIVMDGYLFFDLSNPDVTQMALLDSVAVFALAYVILFIKGRREKKDAGRRMAVELTPQKK